jgi:hypothetical protein
MPSHQHVYEMNTLLALERFSPSELPFLFMSRWAMILKTVFFFSVTKSVLAAEKLGR